MLLSAETKSKLILPTRRGFLVGLSAAVAAPAIIPYANLMPIKVFERLYTRAWMDYDIETDRFHLRLDRTWDKLPFPHNYAQVNAVPIRVVEKIVAKSELENLVPPPGGHRYLGVSVSREQRDLLWHVQSRG